MKKLLVSMAVTVVTASAFAQGTATTAQAESKMGGDFRVRYFNYDNTSGTAGKPTEQFTQARVKLNYSIQKSESLMAFVSLIHNQNFGNRVNNTVAGGDAGTTGNAQNTGTGKTDASLMVNQVYGWWKAGDNINVTVGRMAIDIADGRVFSYNDWQSLPTTHDGLKVGFDFDFASLDLYALKFAEYRANGSAAASDTESNGYLASFNFKNLPEILKIANLHFMQVTGNANPAAGVAVQPIVDTTKRTNMQHLGLTVGGEVVGFTYNVTAAFQTGKTDLSGAPKTDLSASMYDVTLGYSLADVKALKVWLGYHSDTGDKASTTDKNEAYNPLFYNMYDNGGRMQLFRWGNLTYARLGATIMPLETLEVGAEALMLSRTETTGGNTMGPIYRTSATQLLGNANNSGSTLGTEVDVWAKQSYTNGLNLGLRVSQFSPGAALKDNGGVFTESIWQYVAEGGFAF